MSMSRSDIEQSSGPRLEEPPKTAVLLLGWAFLQQELTRVDRNVDETFRFNRAFRRHNCVPSLFRRQREPHHQ